jgi:trimeric autotransporter adhesin
VKNFKKHLSVANALACIALFAALGGGAYAATAMLPNKSVKTRHLATGAVTTQKLRNGAVTRAKLRNGAVVGEKLAFGAVGSSQILDGSVRSSELGGGVVTGSKLKDGAVSTTKLDDGAVKTDKIANGDVTNAKLGGDSVSTGKIQDGAVTASKLSPVLSAQLVKDVSYVTAPSASNTTEATKTATATCPAGKQVVGGGARVVGGDVLVAVTESAPSAPNAEGKRAGWTAVAREASASAVAWSVEVTAICAQF